DDRLRCRRDLKPEPDGASKRRWAMEWSPAMVEYGIPAVPLNTLDDVFADPQVQACGLVQALRHPQLGELRQVGLPLDLGGVPPEAAARLAPPVFGQHTREVLASFGLAREEIDRLLAGRVLHQAAEPAEAS